MTSTKIPKSVAKKVWTNAKRTTFTPEGKQYLDLYTKYVREAKRANTRLLRLEKLATQPHFASAVKSTAYKKAMHSIKEFGGNARFSTAAPGSVQELRSRLAGIEAFLDSPASTKTQIKKSYVKMANTINDKYGTNFTWEELGRFYESEEAATLNSQYGSDTLIYALAAVKRLDGTPEEINRVISRNQLIDEDEVVDEIAKRLIKMGIKAVFT